MSLLEIRCQHRLSTDFDLNVVLTLGQPVTALIGPSGSGKTSLLATIAGFLNPNIGWIALDSRVFFDSKTRVCLPPEQRQVGYVFQEGLLFPHLTVLKNLRYGTRWRHPAHPGPTFEQVVELLEVRPLLSRRPGNLSGGEKQRVALGRALLSHPRLLLLDEPLSALDEPLRLRILDGLLALLQAHPIPALLVTHDLAAVKSLAREVVLLSRGSVVAQGPAETVLAQWKNAPMELFAGVSESRIHAD